MHWMPAWLRRTAGALVSVFVVLALVAGAISDIPTAWDRLSPWLSPFWQDLVAVLPPFVVVGLLLLCSGVSALSLLDSRHRRPVADPAELVGLRRRITELTAQRDRLAETARAPKSAAEPGPIDMLSGEVPSRPAAPRLNMTLAQILDDIESNKPLQRAEAARSFVGGALEFEASFIDGHAISGDLYALLLRHDGYRNVWAHVAKATPT